MDKATRRTREGITRSLTPDTATRISKIRNNEIGSQGEKLPRTWDSMTADENNSKQSEKVAFAVREIIVWHWDIKPLNTYWSAMDQQDRRAYLFMGLYFLAFAVGCRIVGQHILTTHNPIRNQAFGFVLSDIFAPVLALLFILTILYTFIPDKALPDLVTK